MNHNLREAVVVAKIHEKDAAMVAKTVHPSGKTDGLARVGCAEFIACMGTVRMHNYSIPIEKLRCYYIIIENNLPCPNLRINFSGNQRPMVDCGGNRSVCIKSMHPSILQYSYCLAVKIAVVA
jgi:hypothetical protein